MTTKLEQLRNFMREGDHRAALKLAAGWSRLGEARDAIQRGWAALTNPDFYREIGKDPDELIRLGIEAIRKQYMGAA
jgi:hypothetical protein